MKKIIFKCADDALFNVSRAANVEYIISSLKESTKSQEEWTTISLILADTAKCLADVDLGVSRMYVDNDSIILFVEAPEWFNDKYKLMLYDSIRENLDDISNNFSRAMEYYGY